MIVCGGVLMLRYTDLNIPRPFKTPLVPWVPVLGILFCGYLMISLPRRHAGPARGLDGHRVVDLFHLWTQAFGTEPEVKCR